MAPNRGGERSILERRQSKYIAYGVEQLNNAVDELHRQKEQGPLSAADEQKLQDMLLEQQAREILKLAAEMNPAPKVPARKRERKKKVVTKKKQAAGKASTSGKKRGRPSKSAAAEPPEQVETHQAKRIAPASFAQHPHPAPAMASFPGAELQTRQYMNPLPGLFQGMGRIPPLPHFMPASYDGY